MIELRSVSKFYRTHRGPNYVLNGVSFTFPPLTSVGILGRNGAGKSTLLRLLAGVEMPNGGEIVRHSRLSWPIGFAGGFNGSLTAEENCRFVARVYGTDVDSVVGFTREFADIGDYFFEPVKSYSSGMKARVAFGLSMAVDFDFYLVDEVTAVGDRRFQERCKEAFAARRERSAVIMVSHNMSTIREYCSTCAILNAGSLTLYNSIDEAQAAYEELDV